MKTRLPILSLLFITFFVMRASHGQSLEEAIVKAPLLEPQKDGVVYLPVESAALLKWIEKQAVIVNNGGGMLKIKNGRIVQWGPDERPTWRFNLPTPGAYRVVANCSAVSGSTCVSTLTIQSKRKATLVRTLPSVGANEPLQSVDFGEVELDAGLAILELRSSMGASPFSFCHLADLRLLPLERTRSSARAAQTHFRNLQFETDPDLKALIERRDALKKEVDSINAESRNKVFSSFRNYRQFLDLDAKAASAPALLQQYADTLNRMTETTLEKSRKALKSNDSLKPEERAAVKAYIDSHDELIAATKREYPKIDFPSVPKWQVGGGDTLFPTGQWESLPKQQIDETASITELKVLPPSDTEARQKNFALRNSDAGLATLCATLQSVLVPGTKGLEAFEEHCQAGRHRAALEAYRIYFFKKLKRPEDFGAVPQNILFELTRDRGKRELLLRPNDFVIEHNLKNRAVAQIGADVLVCDVGAPGTASWVPHGWSVPESALKDGRSKQDPFWQSPKGKETQRTIEFFRYINCLPGDRAEYYSGGLFPALLWSYAMKGDREHLQRWCEYVDDWTANSLRDQDDFVYGMRMATDLEPQFARCMLNLLRIILDERPELAQDFDAATLARLTMKLVSDYIPYVIRCRRAQMANWGIMSLAHQLHLCRFLSEFKAMRYFNRETWRLWSANMIQHQTLDGENFEAWDEGHNFVNIGFALDGIPFGVAAEGIDAPFLSQLWDQVRVDQRSKLIHISPAGNYWPEWAIRTPASPTTLRNKAFRPDAENRYYLDLIDKEQGAQTRIATLLSGGTTIGGNAPDRRSDLSPYAGMAYLRESWRPDADFFILQNVRGRSQSQSDCSRGMYSLSRNDQLLVEAHGLVVDRKPDNRYYGKVRTGGKTEYCGQPESNVVDARFLSSPSFDFSEALQDSPYAYHRLSYPDVWGLYKRSHPNDDPDAIKDVKVLRQVFGIRGEDLWLVCDGIDSPEGVEREFTQFFALPVRLPTTGLTDRLRVLSETAVPLIETFPDQGLIRTNNPGFDNVSLHCFAPNALTFASNLNARDQHETSKHSPVEAMLGILSKGADIAKIQRKPTPFPVSVRWKSSGKQLFITALHSRSAQNDLDHAAGENLSKVEHFNGANGIRGCKLSMRSGTEVWLQSSPHAAQELTCGPLKAHAERLLFIQKKEGPARGIVLGCRELSVNGRAQPISSADFEFDLAGTEFGLVQSIYRPINTVRISPAQNVFIDRVEVSFDIPNQKLNDVDLRYTLDGAEPTITSPLFLQPITLNRTTTVKVRPFRKGLTQTPWTFSGTDSGKTISATFRQRAPLPVIKNAPKGIKFDYFEDAWPTLFAYAGMDGVLQAKVSGVAPALLDEKHIAETRKSDRAYALRYDATINVPETGVYSFIAPEHLYTPTMDAGYDFRVFVDDEEWLPTPELHCENIWCVPLEKGPHRLRVVFTDYRWKKFRNDYWMAWQEEEMWQGIPKLEVQISGTVKQTIPDAWFLR